MNLKCTVTTILRVVQVTTNGMRASSIGMQENH